MSAVEKLTFSVAAGEVVTLPILGLVGGQAAGLLRSGFKYYGIEGAVIFVLDVVLTIVSIGSLTVSD